MGKFEFRDRTLKLDIAGNVFEIDAAVGEDLAVQRETLINAAKEFQSGKKTKDDTIKVYAEHINRSLGEGAFEKIFAKRIPDLVDCMGIMTFISNEISEFNKKSFLTVVK